MENYIKLQEEIINFFCQEKPVNATYLGIRGYDTFLGDFSYQNIEKLEADREYLLDKLKNHKPENLALNLEIDYELLLKKLETDGEINKIYQPLYRNANLYLETCFYGIYYLALRDSEHFEEKTLAIVERMKQIPKVLGDARINLLMGQNIPKIWTMMAVEMAAGGISFFNDLIAGQIAKNIPESLKNELKTNLELVLGAINNFNDFLQNELMEKSNGSFATGERLFTLLVNKGMHLPYTLEELKKIGWDIFNETEKLMIETAEAIDSSKSWKEIISEIDQDALPFDQLLQFYNEELQKAKKFIIDNDLITIPPDESLKVIDTPQFERNKVPYAAYIPPPPFGNETTGYFWVTPGDDERPSHNKYLATMVSAHEGYPGHHVQFVVTNKNPSQVRKFISDTSMVEGWALYWEENMYLLGYCGDDLYLRLFQLRNKLWRCCRVIIDIGLHTGKMTFDEAVNMLVDKADLEMPNAVGEVKRYTMSPTQPMSYIIGQYEIMKLKEDLKKQQRNEFTLKNFHDSLLNCGPISLPLIRKILT